MGMEVNGKLILASIANMPAAFGMGEPQVNSLAMATLLARFKDRTVGLEAVRAIAGAIGRDDFSLALDHISDKDAAALAKRLDPKNPEVKTAAAPWHREQISRLASGDATPLAAAPKVTKSAASAFARREKPKTGDVMESKALKPRAPRKSAT